MAWYYGTFRCGHEGRVNIIGPSKDREWKKERAFAKLCPECFEKHLQEERERKNKEAEEKAKEMELPELQGSEKQVKWANALRQELIDKFNNLSENNDDIKKLAELYDIPELTPKDILTIRDYILENKDKARYYIDNRNEYIAYIIEREIEEALKSDEEKAKEESEKRLLEELRIEATVYPENAVSNIPAEIKISDNRVAVKFEKNDEFRNIVKSLGYTWNGIWEKDINYTTGTAEDRAAELGNKLLNAGFPILVMDAEVRINAINGIFEPECTRWIYLRTKGNYKGWFAINWKGYDNSLYNTARKLPGSRWSSPSVVVRIEHYKEVEEFAELYGFKFTEKAKQAIEEYKQSLENATVVTPTKTEDANNKDGLAEILESSSDILDDLYDED